MPFQLPSLLVSQVSLVLLPHEDIQRYISFIFYIHGPRDATIERNKGRKKWNKLCAYLALLWLVILSLG